MSVHGERDAADALRRAMDRRDGLSPLAGALRTALRDNPSWRGEYPSWVAVALWAHGYTTRKPTRHEVAAALGELRGARRAA